MSDEIKSARNRLRRAREHAEKFNIEVREFLNSGAYQVIREAKTEGENTVVTFKFKVTKSISDELELTFGDCINQMRSACDNLVVSLGKIHQIPKAKMLAFPVCPEPRPVPTSTGIRHFEGWCKSYPFPRDLLDFLERLQPYNPYVDREGRTLVGRSHPMFILNAFWNEDKHHVPLKITGVNRESTLNAFGMRLTSGGSGTASGRMRFLRNGVWHDVTQSTVSSGRVIENGTEYARITLPPGQPIENIQAPIAIDVTLDKRAPVAGGASAYRTLIKLHDIVSKEVVDGLEPFFP